MSLLDRIWEFFQIRFPDRQLYHRSEGQVRYFLLSTSLQVSALLTAGILAGWLMFTTVSVAFQGRAIEAARASGDGRVTINLTDAQLRRSDLVDAIEADLVALPPIDATTPEEALEMISQHIRRQEVQVSSLREMARSEARAFAEAQLDLATVEALQGLSEEDLSLLIQYAQFGERNRVLQIRLYSAAFFLLGAFASTLFVLIFILSDRKGSEEDLVSTETEA